MKRNIVIRLLAAALAATLVVTGVPNSAFTGIETVYADDVKAPSAPDALTTSEVTDTTIKITATDAKNEYAIEKAGQGLTDAELTWVAPTGSGSSYSVTFKDLLPGQGYNVYQRVAADLSTGAPASAKSPAYAVSTKAASIKDAVIVLEKDTYEYTGAKIEPKIKSVTLGETTLTAGVDYVTVDASCYSNNKDAALATAASGAPTVTITGMGKYDSESTATKTFTITPVTLSSSNAVITEVSEQTYTGEAITPSIEVKDKEEPANTYSGTDDYTVKFEDNTKVGTAKITVTGKGNYTGSITGTFSIAKNSSVAQPSAPTLTATDKAITVVPAAAAATGYSYQYAISTANNTEAASLTWQDEPEFTKIGTENLAAGTSYYGYVRVKASDNNDASSAAVSEQATQLAKTSLTTLNAYVTLDATSLEYTGSDLATAIKSKIHVKYLDGSEVKEIDSGKYTVSFKDTTTKEKGSTTNAGTLEITITGDTTNYSGSIVASDTFTITKKTIHPTLAVGSDGGGKKTYDGTTTVDLKVTADTTVGVASGDTVAVSGLKGDLEFANVSKGIALVSVDSSNVKVTGSGSANYTLVYDKIAGVTGEIEAADSLTITASDVSVAYGETVDIGATNALDLPMTYELEGEAADYYLELTEDGKLTCKNWVTGKNDLKVKITFTTQKTSAQTNGNYSTSATPKEINVTITKAKPVITLGTNVATGTPNEITVAKTSTEAQLKAAIGATLTYAKDSSATPKTTYDISDKLEYKYGTESGSQTGTDFATEAAKGNTVYVKLSYTAAGNFDTVSDVVVKVNLSEKKFSAAPVISAAATSFKESATVTITSANITGDSDGAIYYTEDGSTPTKDSTKYTKPITVNATETIKAIAIEKDKEASDVVSETFTKLASDAVNVTVSVESKTITAGDEYAPKITVASEKETLTDAKTSYTIKDNKTGKEVALATAIVTEGTYTITATVQDATKYVVSRPGQGTLTVQSVAKAIEEAKEQAKTDAENAAALEQEKAVQEAKDAAALEQEKAVQEAKDAAATEQEKAVQAAKDAAALEQEKAVQAAQNTAATEQNKAVQAAKDEAAKAQATAVETAKKEATDAANAAAATAQATAVEAAKKEATEAAEKAAATAQAAAVEAAKKEAATTKVGDTVKIDGNTYKVTSVDKKTVSFSKVKKNATSAYIVSTVTINGVNYKVTSIAKNAFKGDKKLTSVTIPATVTSIGANAFNGCTKLKTITINSSKITKIGSKAFTGVSKKAVVKAPSKKVAAYKKLLKKAKFTGSVKKA